MIEAKLRFAALFDNKGFEMRAPSAAVR